MYAHVSHTRCTQMLLKQQHDTKQVYPSSYSIVLCYFVVTAVSILKNIIYSQDKQCIIMHLLQVKLVLPKASLLNLQTRTYMNDHTQSSFCIGTLVSTGKCISDTVSPDWLMYCYMHI